MNDNDELTLQVSTCTANLSAVGSGGPSYTLSNPRTIGGWVSASVSRGIERFPSGFEVEFTEPYDDADSVIVQPGDYVQVKIGTDTVLTGFVDRYTPAMSAGQHTVRISGRSLCQDLVDCSAYPPNGQFSRLPDQTFASLAASLCGSYGIKTVLAPNTNPYGGRLLPYLCIMVGETTYDVLERQARFAGVLLYDNPNGELVISGVGTNSAANGFEEGINVISAAALYSMDMRFSRYESYLTSMNLFSDSGDGANLNGTVLDDGVPRFRYRANVAEASSGDKNLAQRQVEWERNRRLGRSMQVRITTDSWRDSAGNLYEPNTLAKLDLPGLKLKPCAWLISDVTYKRGLQGTTCDLTIMPPAAFQIQPINVLPIYADAGIQK